MKVIAVAGYGDSTGYIKYLTHSWKRRYGLDVEPFAFGTTKPATEYPELWSAWVAKLEQLGSVAMIGISFGFGIAARSKLEFPDKVGRIVGICCPHDLRDLDPNTIEQKYRMLNYSLAAFDSAKLPLEDVMTVRSTRDEVIDPQQVIIPGAQNVVTPGFSHGSGIVSALTLRGSHIASFINEGQAA